MTIATYGVENQHWWIQDRCILHNPITSNWFLIRPFTDTGMGFSKVPAKMLLRPSVNMRMYAKISCLTGASLPPV